MLARRSAVACAVLYTMGATVSQPLYVDSSFYEPGSSVSNLVFSSGAPFDWLVSWLYFDWLMPFESWFGSNVGDEPSAKH